MEIGMAFILLVIIAIISLWGFTGAKAYRLGQSTGLTYYFLHLIGSIAAVGVLWLIMVSPNLDCSGFLCGLEYAIMWMLGSIVILIVWPIVLAAYLNKKYPGTTVKVKKRNENILDDEVV